MARSHIGVVVTLLGLLWASLAAASGRPAPAAASPPSTPAAPAPATAEAAPPAAVKAPVTAPGPSLEPPSVGAKADQIAEYAV